VLFEAFKRHRLPVAFCIALLAGPSLAGDERTNAFNDPFVQVTSGIAGCPVPEGPLYTAQEVRDVAHVRAQHGGSCYRAGRCRLPNSYLYDPELVARVQKYIEQDGRFTDTSLWLVGERRLVMLMGCVRTREQSESLERAVWLVDDVMGVVNYLKIGDEAPRYPLQRKN
jgi:BON domain